MSSDWEGAVKDVLRDMAETIAAKAPAGWKRAVLHGFAVQGGGSGHRGFGFEPDELNRYGSNDIDIFDGLRRLYTLMEAREHLTAELTVEARGRYRAVLSEALDLAEGGGYQYTLARDSHPPDEDETPVSAATQAGDPREAVALLGAYLSRREDILQADTYAPPPARPELRRRQIEGEIGVRLPEDLRGLYAVIDGDGGEGLLDRHPWFGLEALAEFCIAENRWWVSREWRHHLFRDTITDFGPPLAMRRLADHPAWIPFATSTDGDFLAVDMAPGPRGRPGQVIRIGLHHDDGPVYVADSVTSLLRRHVEALDAGAFQHEDGELWIDLGDMEPRHVVTSVTEASVLEVTGMNAAPVRGLTEGVRHLKVSDAPWVDLGTARIAPALRRLTIENCPAADLSPLRDVPVQELDLSMDHLDLAGLAGHPTLRRVTLRCDKPVDLRPLAYCPRLYELDLAEATPEQAEVLGEFPALLYLNMRSQPWEDLWLDSALPRSLAVAGLAREPLQERRLYWNLDNAHKPSRPTLEDALTWVDNLAGDDAEVWAFKGRFGR